jgi:glycine cleavage system H protein
MNTKEDGGSQGPQGQTSSLKCCWMLAGVVAYKLCDRGYECEKCPFDEAMGRRPHFSSWLGAPRPSEGPDTDSLLFHDRHVWARAEAGGRVTTGLDDFGRRLAGRIYCVELPPIGTRLAAGDAAWTIVHHEGKVSLASPVAGVVEEVNDRLARNPTLVSRDPYGAGWAVSLAPLDLARDSGRLRPGTETAAWIAAESEKLSRHLARAGGSHWTLPDGGRMIDDLHEAIPPDVRAQVLELFLSANTSCPPGLSQTKTTGRKEEREGR